MVGVVARGSARPGKDYRHGDNSPPAPRIQPPPFRRLFHDSHLRCPFPGAGEPPAAGGGAGGDDRSQFRTHPRSQETQESRPGGHVSARRRDFRRMPRLPYPLPRGEERRSGQRNPGAGDASEFREVYRHRGPEAEEPDGGRALRREETVVAGAIPVEGRWNRGHCLWRRTPRGGAQQGGDCQSRATPAPSSRR